MQTPTPTLHGREAVAYVVPVPMRNRVGLLYVPITPEEEPPEKPVAPPPPSPPIRPFDSDGANAAFDALDFRRCRELSGRGGYASADVTFNPDGRVVNVDVDALGNWSSSVVACVRDRLLTVRVAPYTGPGNVTVKAGWVKIPFD